MKWYGIDEDIFKSLVDLITEAYEAAQRMGDDQSETYYSYLLGELEECKVIAKTKRMNSEEEQRMLKLQRYLRMLHEGLKDPKDKNKEKDDGVVKGFKIAIFVHQMFLRFFVCLVNNFVSDRI